MSRSALLSERQASDEFAAPRKCGGLSQILANIDALIAPLWPLKNYVAVNPFLGMSEQPFLAARQTLRNVRECEMLPSAAYFRAQLGQNRICRADVELAYQQCVQEYPQWYTDLDVPRIFQLIEDQGPLPSVPERRYYTIAEIVDGQRQSDWAGHIVNDITRHCSAHYDEGQARWPNPWRHMPLYQAWREAASLSYRMDMLGIKGFHELVGQLPPTPEAAIAWLLGQLDVPADHWQPFLLCEMLSVAGWASWVKYRVREAELAGGRDEDLIGLLAIRLAYDAALARAQRHACPAVRAQFAVDASASYAQITPSLAPRPDVLARHVMQVAAETAHRRDLAHLLTVTRPRPEESDRKSVQMIFCIDVRSELMRRHLETVSDRIETFGFAGFFGMALEYVELGESSGAAHCPALLSPAFRVRETVSGVGDTSQHRAIRARWVRRAGRKAWKSFQSSAVSCFSFVESLGLLYFGKLLSDSLRLTRPVAKVERDGLPRGDLSEIGPDIQASGDEALSLDQKLDLAAGMLRNLGLTDGFARIVVVCGHAAEVVNNPYRAGLDCGACGGHSGEPNARVAATLLNDPQVRSGLADRGIAIPSDTWFVAGVHNTTTDQIRLFDTGRLPETYTRELAQLEHWTDEAGRLCRLERGDRLGNAGERDVLARSRDWSEVRPEWGLAGNAAFIVAPRGRTAGLDLGGRSFLHSYDQQRDPDLKVLELIMTAPMVVTSWINLQYYASAVDNRAFGSGNKAIHNVVGQFGVLSGNGGDLMTGLPWQSVHDGAQLQHEPLRLLVVIDAARDAVERIIDKHAMVRDLVSNGWLTLAVLEGQRFYRRNSVGKWHLEFDAASESLPQHETEAGPAQAAP